MRISWERFWRRDCSTRGWLGRSQSTWLDARSSANSRLPTSGVEVMSSNSLPRIEWRITSAARRMPGLMLTRPTQLPARSSLSMASSRLKSLRSTATARTLCFLQAPPSVGGNSGLSPPCRCWSSPARFPAPPSAPPPQVHPGRVPALQRSASRRRCLLAVC